MNNPRDFALFNIAIDSELRGRDLVTLKVTDFLKYGGIRATEPVVQSKIRKPTQFQISENARKL